MYFNDSFEIYRMNPTSPSNLVSVDFTVTIRWEESEDDLLQVLCNDRTTLKKLSQELILQRPELGNTSFSFMHGGVPIRRELWSMISAFKLKPIVYIREGVFDFIRRDVAPFEARATHDFSDDSPIRTISEVSMTDLDRIDYDLLFFHKDSILVVERGDIGAEWWYGTVKGKSDHGWFPQSHVKRIEQ